MILTSIKVVLFSSPASLAYSFPIYSSNALQDCSQAYLFDPLNLQQ
jgi:hypothetical protein